MGILSSLAANIWVQIHSGFFCSIGINKLKDSNVTLIPQQKICLRAKYHKTVGRMIEKKNVKKKQPVGWQEGRHLFLTCQNLTVNVLCSRCYVHSSRSWKLETSCKQLFVVMSSHWKALQRRDKSSFSCSSGRIWMFKSFNIPTGAKPNDSGKLLSIKFVSV